MARVESQSKRGKTAAGSRAASAKARAKPSRARKPATPRAARPAARRSASDGAGPALPVGEGFALDALLLLLLAAGIYVALAVYLPDFSRPGGREVRGFLYTWLGWGLYPAPAVLLLLPPALLPGAYRRTGLKAWAWAWTATLGAALLGGLWAAGGLTGDSCATLGRAYLGWFYPVLLGLVLLLAVVRLGGRTLVVPLIRAGFHSVARTQETVAAIGETVREESAALRLKREEQQARRTVQQGERARREEEERARWQAIVAAEIEAADAPDGDSPLLRETGDYPAASPDMRGALEPPEPVAPPVIPDVKPLTAAGQINAGGAPDAAAAGDVNSAFHGTADAPAIRPLPVVELHLAGEPQEPDEFAKVVAEAGRTPLDPLPEGGEAADEAPVEPLSGGGRDQRSVPDLDKQLSLFPSTQRGYKLPPLELLRTAPIAVGEEQHLELRAKIIERTLTSFNVEARCTNTVVGPRVTRYELKIGPGINVSKIHNLSDNLALELAVKAVRIEAPIPGLSAVGIEVPNASPQLVTLRSVLESPLNTRANHPLTIGLGRDIAGLPVVANLAKMPHVLVAGATGSGKSVCLNALIISLLYRNAPDTLRLILIDPKRVEMTCYEGLPHLACPVVHDVAMAQSALKWAVAEMERRYRLLESARARNIAAFNDAVEAERRLPFIVVVVDELADLMMLAGQVIEKLVCRIAQLSRAVGIHLVIATQRPDVKVITGTIKANIPSRVAFAVVSHIDSRTILDGSGADKLLGSGDMLFAPIGEHVPVRVQGAYLADDEIDRVVAWCREQAQPRYDESITTYAADDAAGGPGGASDGRDEMFAEACDIVQQSSRASTSYLQRRLKIGYNRAARIMEELEEAGIVSAPDSQGNRKVM